MPHSASGWQAVNRHLRRPARPSFSGRAALRSRVRDPSLHPGNPPGVQHRRPVTGVPTARRSHPLRRAVPQEDPVNRRNSIRGIAITTGTAVAGVAVAAGLNVTGVLGETATSADMSPGGQDDTLSPPRPATCRSYRQSTGGRSIGRTRRPPHATTRAQGAGGQGRGRCPRRARSREPVVDPDLAATRAGSPGA